MEFMDAAEYGLNFFTGFNSYHGVGKSPPKFFRHTHDQHKKPKIAGVDCRWPLARRLLAELQGSRSAARRLAQ
jgi:hypothetical protein